MYVCLRACVCLRVWVYVYAWARDVDGECGCQCTADSRLRQAEELRVRPCCVKLLKVVLFAVFSQSVRVLFSAGSDLSPDSFLFKLRVQRPSIATTADASPSQRVATLT